MPTRDQILQYQQGIKKSIYDSFNKGGRYINNPENRRLHRVGMPYGGQKTVKTEEIKKTTVSVESHQEWMDGNKYVYLGDGDYKLVNGDKKAQKVLSDGKEVIKLHNDQFQKTISELQSLFPESRVKGRVKNLKSAIEKVARKPKYGTPKNLQDITGFRVISGSIEQVKENVKKFKGKYEIVEEDNYIDTPKGGYYRSYHLIGKEKGRQFEIQIRTENQDVLGNWAHNIYKPLTEKQKDTVKNNSSVLEGYAIKMAEYFFKKDTGVKALTIPPCIEIVATTFGCLP
jgi:ppGpp synthetase/RelA/SpoT-type nucleotidyltranferase